MTSQIEIEGVDCEELPEILPTLHNGILVWLEMTTNREEQQNEKANQIPINRGGTCAIPNLHNRLRRYERDAQDNGNLYNRGGGWLLVWRPR